MTGRPPKYTKNSFRKKVDEYLKYRTSGKKGPITLLDFCVYADVYKDYISEHNIGDGSAQDFSEPIKRLKTHAERSLELGTLLGKMNPAMAIFSLKNNFGWKDKTELGLTDKNGEDLIEKVKVEIVEPTKPKTPQISETKTDTKDIS